MYCSVSDVLLINSQRKYDATSTPNENQVQELIREVSALMDGRLRGMGHSVPIPSGNVAIGILRTICSLGVASLAESSSFIGEDRSDKAGTLWRKYDAEMRRIEKNPLILQDTVRNKPALFNSYSRENPDDESTEARFTMGKDF